MATSSVGRTTINGSTTVGGFNPLSLFAAGEQGVWYDPSDLSTMYQDSAGTIPVTAVEQPVGRILDKSGRGNHATQATSANRPVLSARVNLLTYSNAFTSGSWTSPAMTLTSGQSDPVGGTSAWLVYPASTGIREVYVSSTYTSGITYTLSLYVKPNNNRWMFLGTNGGSSGSCVWFDLTNGVVGTQGTGHTGSISSLGFGGWYRITVTVTGGASGVSTYFDFGPCDANGSGTITASGTNGIYVYGADLRVTNQGVNLPPYQRVGAATYGTSTTAGNPDYNTNGFPFYLNFDGLNDYLQVASFTMPLVQRMTAASFAETSAVANAGLVSVYPATGNDYDSLTGYFFGPSNRTSGRFIVTGSTSSSYEVLWTTTPSAIIPSSVMVEDKQTSAGYLRVNSVQVASDTSFTQFSANSNGGLLVGIRWISSAIASPYLNGRVYGVIIRGASSTANQITGTENWLNQKTMAY